MISLPVKNKLIRTGRMTIFVLVFFLAGFCLAGNGSQSGHYILKSRDLRSFRRLVLTNPTNRDSAGFVIPQLAVNYAEGEFSITLAPVDTNLYYGARLIRDTDNQPLELTVNFPDSNTILIVGRTDKLALIADYYAVTANKFIFDLYRTRPTASDLRGEALSLFITDESSPESKSGDNLPVASATTGSWLTPRMVLALKIAGLFLLLFIIIQIFRANRKQKKNTPPKSRKSAMENAASGTATAATQSPADADPVWALAREKGISYDEAVIMMNVNRKKIDVRT